MMSIRRIGVLTSGGDAPGINPAIRSVVRLAIYRGLEVVGIEEGYDGLIRGEMRSLRARDVGGILQRGGTFLRTARCPEFLGRQGQRKALRELNESGIDGLVVIGGDGSMKGAQVMAQMDVPIVGIPSSIDNDIWGTDMSIGVDTALNTIMDAVDKLRDTASSHQRAFIIETMGRNCGYLALTAGIICGAEMILIPEYEVSLEEVATSAANAYDRGKSHCIIIVAEGASINVNELSVFLSEHEVGFETRISILGHITRGGSPSAFDRMLATRMGIHAVDALINGETGVMTGLAGRDIVTVPLDEVVERKREINLDHVAIAKALAR